MWCKECHISLAQCMCHFKSHLTLQLQPSRRDRDLSPARFDPPPVYTPDYDRDWNRLNGGHHLMGPAYGPKAGI